MASDVDRSDRIIDSLDPDLLIPNADYSIFDFGNAGLGWVLYTGSQLKWTNIDISLGGRGNFEFLSSTDARLYGVSGASLH